MSAVRLPLDVLDLVPISSGSSAADALRNTIDLAERAEDLGYRRYWFAEHHLNPGVAGTSPAVLIALVAGATRRIRLGSGGVQSGHRTALSVVEEFGLIDAVYPGRLDLGLGRSGGRNFMKERLLDPRPVPGQGAQVELWVLGSSAGESAWVAGTLGLRFAANYHLSPATVLEAAGAYRDAFVPSPDLARPYVAVSADVVVAPDDASARELASGYGLWVRSIRSGEGAIEFPSPQEAARFAWTAEDRDLVADRVDTQFVGSPETVTAALERLQEATGADELVITTITHDHADRVRSYELLAKEWFN